jgi:hypothetical protein
MKPHIEALHNIEDALLKGNKLDCMAAFKDVEVVRRRILDLEIMLEKVTVIAEDPPKIGHEGSCGPWSLCDGECSDTVAAHYTLERAKAMISLELSHDKEASIQEAQPKEGPPERGDTEGNPASGEGPRQRNTATGDPNLDGQPPAHHPPQDVG